MRTVCVTGMHRSGTSVAARTLDLLGVSLGDPEALMRPGPDNPAGYWENRYLKEFDDELLVQLGGSWDQPPVLAPGWEEADDLAAFRTRASELIDATFGPVGARPDVAAWKDPRLSLLLPFWASVLPVDATLLVVRSPDEVAASLQRRNGIAGAEAALLWLRYLIAAGRADPGRLVLTHRSLLDRPRETTTAIADHVGLPEPTTAVLDAVAAHVDPELRHHDTTADAEPANPVMEMARGVWNGGRPDLDALPTHVCDAIAHGWLRPPLDAELLTRSRAKVVELNQRLRSRKRAFERVVALGGRTPPEETDAEHGPLPTSDRSSFPGSSGE